MRLLFFIAICFFSIIESNAQINKQNDTNLKWFINYRIMMTDTDKDGEISVKEIANDKSKLWSFYTVPQNFKFADKDESGTLSESELKAMRYREEGRALQNQADTYDKALDMYGFKNISSVQWLTENLHVANQLMPNYEWLENNKEKFNEISKSNWLGINDGIVTDIVNNHFLILRRPDLAKKLSTRYPRQTNLFMKSYLKYHKAKAAVKVAKPSSNGKLSKAEMEKASKAPKRSVK